MFSQTFVDTERSARKPWSIVTSFALQILGVTILVIIPLIFTDVLPKRQLTMALSAPPPPAPAPIPVKATAAPARVAPRQFTNNQLLAPRQVPQQIAMIEDAPIITTASGPQAGVVGAVPAGIIGHQTGLIPLDAPSPPAPKKVTETPKPTRIHVNTGVIAAFLVKKIQPAYPQLAKQTRISGTVRFTAIIGREGTIQNLQLISGHPLLVPAAQEAVKQWVYRPTLLSGDPVEVVTQIDVNFVLGQ